MRDLTFVTNKFQEFVSTFVVIGKNEVIQCYYEGRKGPEETGREDGGEP